jgi:hypothetical protein
LIPTKESPDLLTVGMIITAEPSMIKIPFLTMTQLVITKTLLDLTIKTL